MANNSDVGRNRVEHGYMGVVETTRTHIDIIWVNGGNPVGFRSCIGSRKVLFQNPNLLLITILL